MIRRLAREHIFVPIVLRLNSFNSSIQKLYDTLISDEISMGKSPLRDDVWEWKAWTQLFAFGDVFRE